MNRVIELVSLLAVHSAACGQDFLDFKGEDLFSYLENDRPVLGPNFPMGKTEELAQKATAERQKIRRLYAGGKMSSKEVKNFGNALLESKNFVGFMHFSLALARMSL